MTGSSVGIAAGGGAALCDDGAAGGSSLSVAASVCSLSLAGDGSLRPSVMYWSLFLRLQKAMNRWNTFARSRLVKYA